MKVGTDGVLLGAWCSIHNARKMLDIGTGCGVIALMLAQRSHPEAMVDAIELNGEAAAQAKENVQHSPWPGKVNVIHGRVQDLQPEEPYDLVVCNPPFFSQSLLPPDSGRQSARHDLELPHHELIEAVHRLLSESGAFHIILPVTEAGQFIHAAAAWQLYPTRVTRFYSRRTKPQERTLMTFTRIPQTPEETELVLYANGSEKTSDYLRLTGDFYL